MKRTGKPRLFLNSLFVPYDYEPGTNGPGRFIEEVIAKDCKQGETASLAQAAADPSYA